MKATSVFCLLLFIPVTYAGDAPSVSPYTGQQDRAIKALSTEEIDAYLEGKGMGLAKAAELNGYPGPRHVQDLANELNLTPAQISATEKLFATMQARARALGESLVKEERHLDQLFASREISPQLLTNSLERIATLQARIRNTHLQAHIDESRLLSPQQNAHYSQLRGYDTPGSNMHHGAAHDR